MKALVYERAHKLEDFAIKLAEISEPILRELDVLVEVHAVGINPGETFIRRTRSAEPGGRVLLGWEFAGVIVETGSGVRGFKAGDRVFGTGDVTRDGAWAERVAVDYRVVARIPESLTFVDAASLPIGALTAWEAMFREQSDLPVGVERVLIVGGAGGVAVCVVPAVDFFRCSNPYLGDIAWRRNHNPQDVGDKHSDLPRSQRESFSLNKSLDARTHSIESRLLIGSLLAARSMGTNFRFPFLISNRFGPGNASLKTSSVECRLDRSAVA
jgi:threonine dehydrogenase-like Zn-dependent dehydrogenase